MSADFWLGALTGFFAGCVLWLAVIGLCAAWVNGNVGPFR